MTRKNALRFLKDNNVAVISTCYSKLPYSSAIHYVVDNRFNFYFVTTKNTDKYTNISENNNVSIVVGAGPKYVSISARGHATKVHGGEKKKILRQFTNLQKKHNTKIWPVRDLDSIQSNHGKPTKEIVYKIVPQHLVFLNIDDKTYKESLSASRPHTIIPKNSDDKK